jgi:putative transposase
VLLRYRYRIYPTLPQRVALGRAFGCARVVFNDGVAARKAAHAEGRPYPTTAVLSKTLITEAKQTRERSWLAEVSSVVLQQALADCDRAYANFFDSLKGERAGARVGPGTATPPSTSFAKASVWSPPGRRRLETPLEGR